MSTTKLFLRQERCANTGKNTVLCEQEETMISRSLSAVSLTVVLTGLASAVAGEVPPPANAAAKFRWDVARDGWDLGPFVKRKEPVLRPTPDSVFRCPVRGKEVRWEEQNVYNPAAVVHRGKVSLLYRADDISRDLGWRRTCRIGLACSEDGIHFTRHPEPVLYPNNDHWKQYEWEGGCEDLHIVEGEDGVYVMNYTTWRATGRGRKDTMSIATSRDLFHWTKHGPAFRKHAPDKVMGSRTGVVVSRREGNCGRLCRIRKLPRTRCSGSRANP